MAPPVVTRACGDLYVIVAVPVLVIIAIIIIIIVLLLLLLLIIIIITTRTYLLPSYLLISAPSKRMRQTTPHSKGFSQTLLRGPHGLKMSEAPKASERS